MVCLVGVVDPQSLRGDAKWAYYVRAHHWPPDQAACCEFRLPCTLERLPRKTSGAGRLDSDWMDGIFLGLAGTSSEAYIGTANRVEKANDSRLVADSPYSVDGLVNFKASIREYVEGDTDSDAIAFPPTDPSGAYVPEPTAARRMRLNSHNFKQHGYTKDCPGCVSLRDGTSVRARRNHTQACRDRKGEITGGERVRRAAARHER